MFLILHCWCCPCFFFYSWLKCGTISKNLRFEKLLKCVHLSCPEIVFINVVKKCYSFWWFIKRYTYYWYKHFSVVFSIAKNIDDGMLPIFRKISYQIHWNMAKMEMWCCHGNQETDADFLAWKCIGAWYYITYQKKKTISETTYFSLLW